MFEDLVKYPRILVTGPQRSGTRICSVMIAHDTNHYHVDERLVGLDCIDMMAGMLYSDRLTVPIVIQCPGFSRWAHKWPDLEDMLIVWMKRPLFSGSARKRLF